MVQRRTARLMSIGNSSCVIIPKDVIDGYGWVNGQDVYLNIDDNGIYIPTANSISANLVCKRCGLTIKQYHKTPIKKRERCQSNIISHRWIDPNFQSTVRQYKPVKHAIKSKTAVYAVK